MVKKKYRQYMLLLTLSSISILALLIVIRNFGTVRPLNNPIQNIEDNVPVTQFNKPTRQRSSASRKKLQFKNDTQINILSYHFSPATKREMVTEQTITIVSVACGERIKEYLVMMKSAITLSRQWIHFIIFTEIGSARHISDEIRSWSAAHSFSFQVKIIKYPEFHNRDQWLDMFKQCASFRLFIHNILLDVDAVIYVDTDVVFLQPPEKLWSYFKLMNSTQISAVAAEHESPYDSWYKIYAQHPYYEPYGLNTGVMLMNLTRFRSFGLLNFVLPIYEEYKLLIPWGDQDIINILFHFHRGRLLLLPCEWNYRTDHCQHRNDCPSVEKAGIGALHGNREVFHTGGEFLFYIIFQAWEHFKFNSDLKRDFVEPLRKILTNFTDKGCSMIAFHVLKGLDAILNDRKSDSGIITPNIHNSLSEHYELLVPK